MIQLTKLGEKRDLVGRVREYIAEMNAMTFTAIGLFGTLFCAVFLGFTVWLIAITLYFVCILIRMKHYQKLGYKVI